MKFSSILQEFFFVANILSFYYFLYLVAPLIKLIKVLYTQRTNDCALLAEMMEVVRHQTTVELQLLQTFKLGNNK